MSRRIAEKNNFYSHKKSSKDNQDSYRAGKDATDGG